MNEEAIIKRFAENATDIEMLNERVEALELAVSFLLHQLPDGAGLRFLSSQANSVEEGQKAPGVVEALDFLRDLVGGLRGQHGSVQVSQKGQLGS
ncbi:hypothetical protein FY034_13130 [Trichlorobacter lovleyi]|uniref:hypothetical protein n=1 Tax=Trichlorobacter lovleyi TaxID=313985 RepID=UPI00223E9DB8|nr:hypothetical protein [Trichlorobacter lovleyi]QOX79834.1 hypothetical protein FY034_13130 [Trichlorobacter lovleyi]